VSRRYLRILFTVTQIAAVAAAHQLMHYDSETIGNAGHDTTWLGGVAVRMLDLRSVVGSTPGRVAIKWLLLEWATVCGQVNHRGM